MSIANQKASHNACSGLGGGPCKKRSPSESIFRFDGWFSHQAANASHWAAESDEESGLSVGTLLFS
jgi:hypothetical protein